MPAFVALATGAMAPAFGGVLNRFALPGLYIGEFIGVLLDKGISVFGECTGGGEEQRFMARAFAQQTFHEFEAERCSGFDEVGVIVAGKGGAAAGEGIADLVDGETFEGAAG